MASEYGGIVAVQTTGLYYGIQARLAMPTRFHVKGPARHNYFDAYLGLTNPFAEDDPRAEAGVFRYGDRDKWTYFLWSLQPARRFGYGEWGWKEEGVSLPSPCHMKLMFVHDNPREVAFYINGALRWRHYLGRPISRETYDKGGLQVKACIGMDDELKSVYFEEMRLYDIMVCTDKFGAKWVPLSSVGYRSVTKTPSPSAQSWNPLIASYTANGYPKPVEEPKLAEHSSVAHHDRTSAPHHDRTDRR